MPPFQIVRHSLDARSAGAVRALVDQAAAAVGHPVVDELRLGQALGGQAPGFLAALEWEPSGQSLAGYVQAVRSAAGWSVERVVAPAYRDQTTPISRRLLGAVLGGLAGENDSEVTLWIRGASEADDRLAEALGLHRGRELRQLRRPLPVDEPWSLPTRPFVVGQDEAAWLAVNNRAFRHLPDQGGVTLADLQAREREPWFDPEGFLLHEREGGLAGFCWTKVHDGSDPPLGEIYVIGVDPDWQGRGLGRALVLAGLDHLARRRHMEVGILYVDAANTPALRLYDELGFTLHHVDRAYHR